jgi:hypothetical protein
VSGLIIETRLVFQTIIRRKGLSCNPMISNGKIYPPFFFFKVFCTSSFVVIIIFAQHPIRSICILTWSVYLQEKEGIAFKVEGCSME